MRENNRKPIEKCRKKLPQFTTMNVIDGQAGLVIYSSLIFYSLTIDNILNIIVLLILAGVTISALTGDNGILTRVNESKTQTEIGEEKEALRIAYNGVMTDNLGDGVTARLLQDELRGNGYTTASATGENPIVVTFESGRIYEINASGNIAESKPTVTLDQAKEDSILDETTDTKVQIGDKIVKVPAGFKVADDSGETIDDGIVITDAPDGLEGNEFVWVPVNQENFDEEFIRRAGYESGELQSITNYGEVNAEGINVNVSGTETGVTESSTTVQEAKDMYASVKRNEGFYIGRYEAGTTESSGKGKRGDLVIKKGAYAYDYVNWSNDNDMSIDTGGVVEIARNFAINRYPTVTSTLCYGVQWDRTLAWIEEEYTGFSQNSDGMGWYDSNYEEGNLEHKTGIDLVDDNTVKNMTKNIYDLAGNVWEMTMESKDNWERVHRGGSYYSNEGSDSPASRRFQSNQMASNTAVGFRITLFLNS